jgi:hypothetical protein
MANLNKDSLKRQLVPGGTWGRNTKVSKSYTAASASIADVIYLALIPAGSRVDDVRITYDKLAAASSTLDVGYINEGGSSSTYWLGSVDTHTGAGSTRTSAYSIFFDKDTYVIATVGGASSSGKIEVVVDYEYLGM